ncbi:hypothetical protein B7Y94_03530 [Candidatus Saccharibacteria bacterium 32-49-12]|nr:MAG: hypothetical protein B7Y94_03530 [Candidatus Saccharibacteria bacterium 32-49-12]
MKPKINVVRAVSATVARRALNLAVVIVGIILGLLFAIIWALAYFVSSWWWLLLIGYVPLLLATVIVLAVGRFLTKKLYPHQLSGEQRRLLNGFTDKIQRLLETRGIGWPMFALLNVKDLLFHRDLRTTKDLISDTSSLRKDFAELEKKL